MNDLHFVRDILVRHPQIAPGFKQALLEIIDSNIADDGNASLGNYLAPPFSCCDYDQL